MFMEVEKINPNPLEGLKEQFLRMQSPSAFGSIRRFDDTSFMNVPPEMARRDAAFIQLEKIIYGSGFPDSCRERRVFYSNMIRKYKQPFFCGLPSASDISVQAYAAFQWQFLNPLSVHR